MTVIPTGALKFTSKKSCPLKMATALFPPLTDHEKIVLGVAPSKTALKVF